MSALRDDSLPLAMTRLTETSQNVGRQSRALHIRSVRVDISFEWTRKGKVVLHCKCRAALEGLKLDLKGELKSLKLELAFEFPFENRVWYSDTLDKVLEPT